MLIAIFIIVIIIIHMCTHLYGTSQKAICGPGVY